MFKTRLKQWNYTKNYTANEVAKYFRLKRRREAAGEISELQAVDDVEFRRVERYLKRKNARLDAMEQASTQFAVQRRLSSTAPSLKMSKLFEDPEVIFISIRDFVAGSFDNGTWVLEDGFTIYSSNISGGQYAILDLDACLYTVSNILKCNTMYQAGPVLLQGFSLIERCLREAHVHTLHIVFRHVLKLKHQWPEVANSLLRQFARLAAVILPRMHPLRQILNRLASLDPVNLDSTILIAWKSTLDQLEGISGPRNSTLLDLLEDFELSSVDYSSEQSQRIYNNLVEMLRLCEVQYSKFDAKTLGVLFLLMRNRYYSEADEEAESLAIDICERADLLTLQSYAMSGTDSTPAAEYKASALEYMAYIQYSDARSELAEENFRQLIKIKISQNGWTHPNIMWSLVTMEKWLTEWGKPNRAAEIRTQIVEIVDSMEMGRELPIPDYWKI